MKVRMLFTTAGVALGAAACHHAGPQALSPAPVPAPQVAQTYPAAKTTGPAAQPAKANPAPALTSWGVAAADSASLADRIHFAFDSSSLSPQDITELQAKRQVLAANPSLRIEIDGNCDERGSEEYNLALGERRAAAAKRWLMAYGIAENRITVKSYGEERPLDSGHNETAWAANRRDDFLVLR